MATKETIEFPSHQVPILFGSASFDLGDQYDWGLFLERADSLHMLNTNEGFANS